MAYTQITKDNAMSHFLKGKPIEEIGTLLGVPLKTLYNWRKKYQWDSQLRIGNIEIANNIEQEMYKLVQKMIDNESIGDPAQVDKLVKLTKGAGAYQSTTADIQQPLPASGGDHGLRK